MTRQLEAWSGGFGDDYVDRCPATEESIQQRMNLWREVLPHIKGWHVKIESPFGNSEYQTMKGMAVLEVGGNVGINLAALDRLAPGMHLWNLEPNRKALDECVAAGRVAGDRALHGSIYDLDVPPWRTAFSEGHRFDMVFATGVLIHVHPSDLLRATTTIVNASSRYVYCQEYFSHEPESKRYRGWDGLLWTRDFGSWYLDNHPELKCIANGFFWQRTHGVDNNHWWLFEKQ